LDAHILLIHVTCVSGIFPEIAWRVMNYR